MRWSGHYRKNNFNRPHLDPNAANAAILWNAAFAFAVCFLLASFGPREFFAASLSSLLFVAAFFSAVGAGVRGEPVEAPHLSNWDVAAAFLLASLVLSWFVDPDAVRAYLEAHGQTDRAGSS